MWCIGVHCLRDGIDSVFLVSGSIKGYLVLLDKRLWSGIPLLVSGGFAQV
jgi:hypothetical protein